MFPRAHVEVEISIPAGDDYWVPKPSEIGEEGFGDFRGVWPIVEATTRLTADVIEDERVAAEYIDAHASTPEEFEKLAREIESYSPSLEESEALEFAADLGSAWGGFEGLELGVAGLTYALSNAGFYPAASCRSHQDGHSWSAIRGAGFGPTTRAGISCMSTPRPSERRWRWQRTSTSTACPSGSCPRLGGSSHRRGQRL
jgi:hypothetical protein